MNFCGLTLCLALFHLVTAAKFPADLERCKFADIKCISSVVNTIFKGSKHEYAGLNIPRLDPLRINKMDIEQGGQSPISVVINLKNVDLFGISDATILDLKGFNENAENDKIEFKLKLPKLTMLSKYKISGRVLVLPIQGDGRSNMTMDNVVMHFKMETKLVAKNNKDYLAIKKFKSTFDTTKLYMHFTNLFNGDRVLGDTMNRFLNDNWQDILRELKPSIDDAFGQIFRNIINESFSKVPHKELFLS